LIAIELVLVLFALMILLPVTVLAVQVVAALPRVAAGKPPDGVRPRVAVLMPAHNEALLITETVRMVVAILSSGDRLLVVADNCSDETAQLAAQAGAEVVERRDSTRRGKSYALDFGVSHLKQAAPDVVVVLDADCTIDAASFERIVRMAGATKRPAQALYMMHAPASAGLKMRILAFAWCVKNQVRALGWHRLGFSCQLTGTGMAFPWQLISKAEIASGHLAEDYKLGVDLALAGAPPLFCPEALVSSYFPASKEGIASQRLRWEHGYLAIMLGEVPRVLLQALRRFNGNLFAVALDLCVPPLALLLLCAAATSAAGVLFFALGGPALPAQLACIALLFLGLSVLLSWLRYGRQIISLGSLACAPFYALSKIPLYFKFLANRQVEWVRSRRDGEQ